MAKRNAVAPFDTVYRQSEDYEGEVGIFLESM